MGSFCVFKIILALVLMLETLAYLADCSHGMRMGQAAGDRTNEQMVGPSPNTEIRISQTRDPQE